ncbi:NinB protein [Cupriavidus phytorum]|uniref:NinB protein n=1 Tax=Cupriavidus phytorum TaxID=3024399 RepID=A0A2W7PS64_9BURK|nr:recombination protein NinB [Cupriavidus alkaliphilus]PZX29455.1 NinB protein [Cupriavidus alkaliphilus]
MSKQIYRLVHRQARAGAQLAITNAPDGYIVTVSEPTKSRDQEAKYHAMFADVARCCTFMGEKRDAETWKRLLVDAFARVKAAEGDPIKGQGQIIPSLDGSGFVQLGIQTRRFSKKHASEFIEYLYAWGADRDVNWTGEARYAENV